MADQYHNLHVKIDKDEMKNQKEKAKVSDDTNLKRRAIQDCDH